MHIPVLVHLEWAEWTTKISVFYNKKAFHIGEGLSYYVVTPNAGWNYDNEEK